MTPLARRVSDLILHEDLETAGTAADLVRASPSPDEILLELAGHRSPEVRPG